ncbi:MAG: 50S ribosome-binding GTPase [Melioribacteraceae bacterium]|nr:50S ribosome-binding GTPase [Melioribacteraceae bacterium]MCF8353592.1 50S ribosome-binding GTPase [Melioribacteraceae bacterium]MCF8393515.1 50S ribosome-binding GTPase [Melioribacteraceae bacterium]MCF8419325.1 50S ribosome-binding GTPase [Melioribacteraceae bacterium]
MPTNLPPEYFDAERRYKEAIDPQEKSDALEELLSTIPKHKGTDKLRADLRKKLSKIKSQAQQSKKKSAKFESNFHIEKEGDARVIVIGAANVGKSSLVKKLTHAEPDISESPFSTWAPTPGMLDHRGVHIQLIDTPAIDRDYVEPEFADLIKNSDLILIMIDLQAFPIPQFQKTVDTLEKIRVVPRHTPKCDGDTKTKCIPMIVTVNKDDGEALDDDFDVLNELLREEGWTLLPVSVKEGRNLEELLNFVIKELRVIRVFSKPPHEEADKSKPFVLKENACVEDFAIAVHKDFLENLKSARVWGKEVHDGQKVGKDHILHDGDIVELHV